LLILLELGLFTFKNPFGIAKADFFRIKPSALYGIMTQDSPPRIAHNKKGFGLEGQTLETYEDWREAQTAFLPNLSLPYHLRSASGYGTVETGAKSDFFNSQDGEDYNRKLALSACRIFCRYRPPAERTQPSQVDIP